jgi:hypothetical protein
MAASYLLTTECQRDRPKVSNVLDRLGNVFNNLYKFDEARQMLDRALKISEAKFGGDHPRTADIHYSIACVYLVQQGTLIARPVRVWSSRQDRSR